jgi:hypothetical protein
MNILHAWQVSPAVHEASGTIARLKKLGFGAICFFTLKGLVTGSLLGMAMLEFIKW